jgi:hypothetical protein
VSPPRGINTRPVHKFQRHRSVGQAKKTEGEPWQTWGQAGESDANHEGRYAGSSDVPSANRHRLGGASVRQRATESGGSLTASIT